MKNNVFGVFKNFIGFSTYNSHYSIKSTEGQYVSKMELFEFGLVYALAEVNKLNIYTWIETMYTRRGFRLKKTHY